METRKCGICNGPIGEHSCQLEENYICWKCRCLIEAVASDALADSLACLARVAENHNTPILKPVKQ